MAKKVGFLEDRFGHSAVCTVGGCLWVSPYRDTRDGAQGLHSEHYRAEHAQRGVIVQVRVA